MGSKLRICYFLAYILSVLSARFQLKNWSAPAWLSSAQNLHSSGSLEPENSSWNSSLVVCYEKWGVILHVLQQGYLTRPYHLIIGHDRYLLLYWLPIKNKLVLNHVWENSFLHVFLQYHCETTFNTMLFFYWFELL